MLRLVYSIPLLALLATSGCTSSSLDELAPRPSAEVTNSVVNPARPNAPVAQPVVRPQAAIASVAEQPADVEAALVETGSNAATARLGDAAPEQIPPVEAVALVAVPKPTLKALEPPPEKASPFSQGDLQVFRRRFRDAKPINFGRSSPKDHAVHGVDVSRWQGNIDWQRLRSQGANFAFIKATDGGDHVDPMFRKNWRGAHEAGLKRGAYHFFYWCRNAESQAKWFIRNVPKVAGALPPVIDVEWNGESRCKRRPSPEQVREKMRVFMDRLEAHYGQRPIIYTAPDFYADNLKDAFPNHPFWLRAVARHPSKVYPGRKWLFWQYSGSGLSHGVSGKIDLNAFHGSEAEWHDWVQRTAG